jgi:hypothetical protein
VHGLMFLVGWLQQGLQNSALKQMFGTNSTQFQY